MERPHPYRDELGAAQARIRELEQRLEDQQRPAAQLAEAWLVDLRAKRDGLLAEASRGLPRSNRIVLWAIASVLGALLATTLMLGIFVATPALLGALPLLVLLAMLGWLVRNQPRLRLEMIRPELAALDSKMRDVERTAAMVARAPEVGAAGGARIAVPEEPEAQEEVPEARPPVRREL